MKQIRQGWKARARLKIGSVLYEVLFEYGVECVYGVVRFGSFEEEVCPHCHYPKPCVVCGMNTGSLGDFSMNRFVIEAILATTPNPAPDQAVIEAAILRHSRFTSRFCFHCVPNLPPTVFWGESEGVHIEHVERCD